MNLKRIEAILIACLPICLVFGWASLVPIGSLKVRPFVPVAMLIVCSGVISGSLRSGLKQMIACRSVIWFFIAYEFAILAQTIAAIHHGTPEGSIGAMAKGFLYSILAAFISAVIASHLVVDSKKFPKYLVIGSILGLVSFVLTLAGTFALEGKNVFALMLQDLARGDTESLRMSYYTKVFRLANAEVTPSFRNNFVTSFTVILCLLMSLRGSVTRGLRHAALAAAVVAGFLVIASVSRVNMIGLSLVGLGIFVGTIGYSKRNLKNLGAIMILLVVGACGTLLLLTLSESGATDLIFRRFGSDIARDGRADMYMGVVFDSSDHWLWGLGFGASPDGTRAERIHNFVLGSYYEGGVIAVVPAIICLVFLTLIAWEGIRQFVLGRQRLPYLQPMWWCAFPLFVFLRMNIAGGVGLLPITDWTGLSIFFSVLLASHHLQHASSPSKIQSDFPDGHDQVDQRHYLGHQPSQRDHSPGLTFTSS